MPNWVRVTHPAFGEKRVNRRELADAIAQGWAPKWDQSLETLSVQVDTLREAVVDLAGEIEGAAGGDGPAGGGDPVPGAAGKSAYDLAVQEGFTGSLSEWLASLVGPEGDAGPQGNQGDPGPQGDPGTPGADSVVPGPPGVGFTAVAKTIADQAFTSTSLANVTGLSFPVLAATAYKFEALLAITSAATTTGWQFGITSPATASFLAVCEYQSSATAWTSSTLTAPGGFTLVTAAYAANTPLLVRITGLLYASSAGTVQLQARTEVANSAITVRRGSTLTVT